MAENNPFAPPLAEVADVRPATETAPPLWNPNAAAAWSILLSPIFGSYLHTRNWEALGQRDKAEKSRRWMVGCIAFFAVLMVSSLVLPESKALDGLGRLGGLVLLIAWYYGVGKSQQAFVLARFGTGYPRKGWSKPLLAAVGMFIAFLVVMVLVGIFIGVSSRTR